MRTWGCQEFLLFAVAVCVPALTTGQSIDAGAPVDPTLADAMGQAGAAGNPVPEVLSSPTASGEEVLGGTSESQEDSAAPDQPIEPRFAILPGPVLEQAILLLEWLGVPADGIESDYYKDEGPFAIVPKPDFPSARPDVTAGGGGNPSPSSSPELGPAPRALAGGSTPSKVPAAAPSIQESEPPTLADGPASDPMVATISSTTTPQAVRLQYPIMVLALVGAVAVIHFGEQLRWLLSRVGWATLFSRVSQDALLSNPRRQRILEFVKANPGCRLAALRSGVGIPNGALFHHILLMSSRRMVTIKRSGSSTRIFLPGAAGAALPLEPETRQRVYQSIQKNPGASHKQIGAETGLSKRIVSYHVRQLARAHRVSVHNYGRFRRCWPEQASPALGVTRTGIQAHAPT